MENWILCGSSWSYVAGVTSCKVSRQLFIRWNGIRSLLIHTDCVPRIIGCVSYSRLSWKLAALQAVKYYYTNSYKVIVLVLKSFHMFDIHVEARSLIGLCMSSSHKLCILRHQPGLKYTSIWTSSPVLFFLSCFMNSLKTTHCRLALSHASSVTVRKNGGMEFGKERIYLTKM